MKILSNQIKKVVIFTGANRGLGRATAELLSKSNQASCYHIILTGRDKNKIEEAKFQILKEQNAKNLTTIETQTLDLNSPESIFQFSEDFKKSKRTLDVLFNNAGYVNKQLDDYSFQKKPDSENLRITFGTNFFGPISLTQQLSSSFSQNAKVFMISSNLGQLQYQGKYGKLFLSNQNLTLQDLNEAAHNYINNAQKNDPLMFCNSGYHTSKAFLNAYVRFVGINILQQDQSMYAIHPGWVKTEMGGEHAEESIDESCQNLKALITDMPYCRTSLSFKLIYRMNPIQF